MTGSVKRLANNIFCTDGAILERLPSTWTHVIDKDSLKIKELEHVLIEKIRNFLGSCPSNVPFQHSARAVDCIAVDYRQMHASLGAANSRGHGSAE